MQPLVLEYFSSNFHNGFLEDWRIALIDKTDGSHPTKREECWYLMVNETLKILSDKPNNENFQNKLEKGQYRTCLGITGAIQGTSRTKLYDELGLHSLIKRRWYNKLIFFYKIVNGLLPEDLYSCLDFPSQKNYSLRSTSASVIKPSSSRIKSFKNTFSCIA